MIRIICVGKTKQNYIKDALDEYIKRASVYIKIKIDVLPDVKLKKSNNIEMVKKAEGELIHKKLDPTMLTVALDEHGDQMTSVKFAKFIEQNNYKIQFVIGGVYGLSKNILANSDKILSFSKSTFTHQMIRVILSEQLYRACTIINGKKYHY